MSGERYSRQTMVEGFGVEGQRRLAEASVLIVGVGGLGSAAALYLAGAGVGRLVLADADTVSESNLPRQSLYRESDIGGLKVVAARRELLARTSCATIDICPEGLTPENAGGLVAACDLVVDCTDNYPTRYLIDDVCAELSRPWVYGAIGEMSGQLSLFNHRAGRRYAELYPDREMLCSLPRRRAGVLAPTAGVFGCLQAAEAVKVLAAIGRTLEGRLMTIDLMTMRSETIDF